VEERRPATPAPDAGQRPDGGGPPLGRAGHGASPRGVPPHEGPPPQDPPPDAERRPIGALLIVGFLTLTIMVSWYGMFALNLVRN
jgi:hypothetical protein